MGTGDVSFRIYWAPATHDIDLHVIDPNGHHLSWQGKSCSCRGELDRDDTTSGGPENIYWPVGKGPNGVYRYYVHYYEGRGLKQVTIQTRKDGKVVRTQKVQLKAKNDESEYFTYDINDATPPVWQPATSP